MHKKSQKIIFFSVMVALSAVLSYFDSYICSFITFGMVKYKLGLANIVIMVVLYNYDFKSTFFTVVVKSLIVGFLFGANGIVTFTISVFGSILSLVGMYLLKKLLIEERFTPFIGLIGGFLHPIGQFIGVMLLYGFKEFLASSIISAPIMLLMGIITGLLVGLSSQKINKILENKFKKG